MTCYEKSCRLCLKEYPSNKEGIDCTSISELRDAIARLFDVEIIRTDTSKTICNKCFENVMAFKAFKKTVFECQKIIKDYETIKKKVMESRVVASIKEEIIDLSNVKPESSQKIIKRKRPITNPVTDSQINDILDLVHDNSTPTRSSDKVSCSNQNKRPKVAPATVNAISIKIEPPSNTPPSTPVHITDDIEQIAEPISSTSKDNTEKVLPTSTESAKTVTQNYEQRNSFCSTSTSGVGSSLDTSKIIKKEPQTVSDAVNSGISESSETNIETVSSSVPTLTEEAQKTSNNTLNNNNTHFLSPAARKDIRKSVSSANQKPESNQNLKIFAVNEGGGIANKNAVTLQSNNDTSPGIAANIHNNCPKCVLSFKSLKDLNIHLTRTHKVRKTDLENKETTPKNKQLQKVKEENSISSSEEDKVETFIGRERSCRQAKSQALKKLSTPPGGNKHPPHNTSTPISPKKNSRPPKLNESTTETMNESSTSHTKSTTSSNTDLQQKATTDQNSINKFKDNSSSSTKPKDASFDKKRVITITLLRTKDSVNFRYCDQYKQSIEFSTVSPEELEDIRSSLMIPEIWANLTNVFKTSPPDEKTIEQLKTIFGEKFRI